MRIGVVNFFKVTPSSTIASNRIAVYIAQMTGAALIDSPEAAFPFQYDVLYVINGPPIYCKFIKSVVKLVGMAKEVVWVGNDYACRIPKWVKDKRPLVMAAYDNAWSYPRHVYVNWNQLTYEPGRDRQAFTVPGVAYYGAYREQREVYFKKYLSRTAPYPVHISASGRAQPRFALLHRAAHWFDATDLLNAMGRYQASIYLEDNTTHKVYCSPANRFYELLSAGCAQYFDKSCQRTFDRAGLNITPWAVDSAQELAERLQDSEQDANAQRRELYLGQDYLGQLRDQFSAAQSELRA